MSSRRVLFVGESFSRYSQLVQSLTRWGADCHFATSCADARSIVERLVFELVIAEMKMGDGSIRQLMALLQGFPTALFCSYPIEDSCLWIPFIDDGAICFGVPVLRPDEFGRVLLRTLANERYPRALDSTNRERCLQTETRNARWPMELPNLQNRFILAIMALTAVGVTAAISFQVRELAAALLIFSLVFGAVGTAFLLLALIEEVAFQGIIGIATALGHIRGWLILFRNTLTSVHHLKSH